METAVALPTLTPLQISFGWRKTDMQGGYVWDRGCVSVCGVDVMEAGIQSGTKQDNITL